jgi:hypothetical protein
MLRLSHPPRYDKPNNFFFLERANRAAPPTFLSTTL